MDKHFSAADAKLFTVHLPQHFSITRKAFLKIYTAGYDLDRAAVLSARFF